MKQFRSQAPHMACMFFSVDEDADKILCMSWVPEVSGIHSLYCVLSSFLLQISKAGNYHVEYCPLCLVGCFIFTRATLC